MQWLLLGFALFAGVLNTLQTGANTQLNKALAAPAWALTTIGGATLLTGVAAVVLTGARWAENGPAQAPWWAWIGGIGGATYILANLLVADKVGAAVFMGLTVTAAVITSLIMDHFGLLGFEVHKAGIGRVAGGALMVAGLGLIAKF
jgi:bacterial/archaeal transporter family-2 protein